MMTSLPAVVLPVRRRETAFIGIVREKQNI
jgi:hypothetical protein